jgi:hypothetical protein
MKTEANESMKAGESRCDIWDDTAVITYLKTGTLSNNTVVENKRIVRRAISYRFDGNTLLRVISDQKDKVVTKIADRDQIIKKIHEQCGHFGARRTLHLVMLDHWWGGMLEQVRELVRPCPECDKVQATFNVRTAELQPLEVIGMFYRWGVDLCGPFNITTAGNRYIMIMVQHFSKHMEAVAIPTRRPTPHARCLWRA